MGNKQSHQHNQAEVSKVKGDNQGGQDSRKGRDPSIQKKKNIKKLDQEIVNNLKSSKLISSQAVSHSRIENLRPDINYQEYKSINLPHQQNKIRIRGADYAHQLNQIAQNPSKVSEINDLTFELDTPGGVSEQAQMYHFDYDVAFHRYLNLETHQNTKISHIK